MPRRGCGAAAVFWLCGAAWAAENPEELLSRFKTVMRGNLERLPDYTCAMRIERFSRFTAERPWERLDELKLEVAYAEGQELYARQGARRFGSQPLAEMITRGTIGTGHFGLLAAHIFLQSKVKFGFEGEGEENGHKALDFHFDVAPGDSAYKIRTAGVEAVTGFQGRFRVDAETLDLVRLEAHAYDIPEKLGLAEVQTVVNYARQRVGSEEFLLPVSASLQAGSSDGNENLNRIRLASCRKYQTESTLTTDAAPAANPAPAQPAAEAAGQAKTRSPALPAGTVFEVALDSPLDPQRASIGEAVLARIVKVKGDVAVAPGALLRGRVVRVEREITQSPVYQLGLEFDTLEAETGSLPLSATMESAGPAAGLIRQTKRLEPTFAKHSKGQMNVLVREVQKGQGILLWEARQGPIPRGLKMTWRVLGDERDPR